MTESGQDNDQMSEIQELQEQLKQKPNDVNNHCRLGWAFLGADRLEEAVDVLRSANQRWPQEIEIGYALGLALKRQGHGTAAIEIFGQAAGIEVNSVRAGMMKQLAEEQREYLLQHV